jgi:hypothetical protein
MNCISRRRAETRTALQEWLFGEVQPSFGLLTLMWPLSVRAVSHWPKLNVCNQSCAALALVDVKSAA